MAPSLNYIDQIVMILSSVQSFVVDGICYIQQILARPLIM